MRAPSIIAALAILALAPAAAQMPAQEGNRVTIVAQEEGCPEGSTFCLVPESGNVTSPGENASIEFTFRNDGATPHNLHVATLEDADRSHADSDSSKAVGSSNLTVAPGSEETFTVEVPANATGLYLWCDIPGHESTGMWLEQEFEDENATVPPGGNRSNQTNRTPGGNETEPVPAPALLVVVALALAALPALRRRR